MLQHIARTHDPYIHSRLIYNSQKLETIQIYLNRGMDTEIVAHFHNDFMKFLGKWMEFENITLSEVTPSHKGTHGMYSLIRGS